MKNILTGAAIGAATGITADAVVNDKNNHAYVESAVIGGTVGAIGGKLLSGGAKTAKAAAPKPVVTPPAAAPVAPAPQAATQAPAAAPKPVVTPPAAAPVAPAPQAATQAPAAASVPKPAKPPRKPIINMGGIKSSISNASSGVSSTASRISNNIVNSGSRIASGVVSGAKNISSRISRGATNIASSISDAASAIATKTRDTASLIKTTSYSAASNAINSTATAGKRLIATAKEAKIPTVNLNLNRLKAPTINIKLPKVNAKGLLLGAVLALSPQALHAPQVVGQIAHAQQSLAQNVVNTAAKTDFSTELKRRIIQHKMNNNDPFIIVDTTSKKITALDKHGVELGKADITIPTNYSGKPLSMDVKTRIGELTESGADDNTVHKFFDANNIEVPKGFHVFAKSSHGGVPVLMDTESLHNLPYTRANNIKSDKRLSIGLKNTRSSFGVANTDQFRTNILANVGDSPLVVVTSNNDYLGLSPNPMVDQNATALEIVEKMNPRSNFLVADKKDRLMGLYNPDGKLIDYYNIGLGRDSANTDEFGISEQRDFLSRFSNDPDKRQDFIDRLNLRSTPSGVFEMTKRIPKIVKQGAGDAFVEQKQPMLVNAFNGKSPMVFSIHNASSGNMAYGVAEYANRSYNPLFPRIASNGCIIVDDNVMQGKIMPRLGDRTIVAVLPNKGSLHVGGAVMKDYKHPTVFENLTARLNTMLQRYNQEGIPATQIKPTQSYAQNISPLQSAIQHSALRRVGSSFKPGVGYRCADTVSTIIQDAIEKSGITPSKFRKTLLAKDFAKMAHRINPADALPGDIIGFTNTHRKSHGIDDLTHVGIYSGNNMFIHRPSADPDAFRLSPPGGVVEENLHVWLKARKYKNVQMSVYRLGK